MELKIQRRELLKGLQRVQGISEAKGTMPILSYLLMETEEGGITISATDLEIGIKASYKAEVMKEGRITLNARKIFDIVRELPEEEILLSSSQVAKKPSSQDLETQDIVRAGFEPALTQSNWITILCGNSNFKIPSLPPEDFPSIPVYEEEGIIEGAQSLRSIEFEGIMLKEMIRKTFFSISTDETRPTLNGLLLQVKGEDVYMISTDGYRLTYIKRRLRRPIPAVGAGLKPVPIASVPTAPTMVQEFKVIIPKKTLVELLKLLEGSSLPVLFSIQKNHAAFRINGLFMISRLIEGEFPNYENLIPKENNKRVIINRDNLIYALRRVSLLADEKSRMVKFNIKKNQLSLISDSTEMGEAEEEIGIEYQEDEMTIGLNARYLLDIASATDTDDIYFVLKDPKSPCLITPAQDEDYKCVVMPMRIEDRG